MKKNLTLREKDHLVRNIYKSYQRAQLDILYFQQHYNYYPQVDLFKVKENTNMYMKTDSAFLNQLQKKQKLEDLVNIVNQIHRHLSHDVTMFIEHEYLNFYDEYWWQDYFSQSSYYRLKHRALDEIIDCAQTFWDDDEMLSFMK